MSMGNFGSGRNSVNSLDDAEKQLAAGSLRCRSKQTAEVEQLVKLFSGQERVGCGSFGESRAVEERRDHGAGQERVDRRSSTYARPGVGEQATGGSAQLVSEAAGARPSGSSWFGRWCSPGQCGHSFPHGGVDIARKAVVTSPDVSRLWTGARGCCRCWGGCPCRGSQSSRSCGEDSRAPISPRPVGRRHAPARRRAAHSGHRVWRGLLMRWKRARPGPGVPSVGSRHVGGAPSCGHARFRPRSASGTQE